MVDPPIIEDPGQAPMLYWVGEIHTACHKILTVQRQRTKGLNIHL